MFIYLSKKIAIPNNVRLKSLSWNGDQGWIACGGENGMLKVLKLDSGNPAERQRGLAAPSNLSMNQTLEGHNGPVMCVTWNENYRKLTTSDEHGLIIVWMLHKGMWFEEMINNRNVSTVRDMKWARDGQRICIAYEDGHVIVGSVDGNRLWGKELGIELCFLEWAPDGRNLLFATLDHKVQIYDSAGNYVAKLPLLTDDKVPIVAIEWYDVAAGLAEHDQPSLALGFANGLLQLMRGEADDQPIVVDTGMAATKVRWNTTGTVIVVAGTHSSATPGGERREIAMMQFLSPKGEHLRTLKVPGSSVASLSFEGGSLRIAIAVDSFIYFANIRPNYKWGFFAETIVCAYPKFERADSAVLFANVKSGERTTVYVRKLLHVRSCSRNCALVALSHEGTAPYRVQLCNAVGSPIDSKDFGIEPRVVALTDYHFVACSGEQIYVWQYRTLTAKLTSVAAAGASLRRREGREQAFHVDDLETGAGAAGAAGGGGAMGGLERDLAKLPSDRPTADPIIAVCATERLLLLARESSALLICSLPHVSLEARHQLGVRPVSMAVNCDGTRLSVVDANGALTLFSLETDASSGEWGGRLQFERKDVWDFKWAADNPQLFALMEKTRMHVFRGLEAEEPVLSSAFLCDFSDLAVSAALLDELVAQPESASADLMLTYDTKALRDAKEALHSGSIPEAYALVEQNSHPRLWRLVAEAALGARELAIAEKASVKAADYSTLQLIAKLKLLDDARMVGAEVHAYYGRFDEAEQAYLAMDRRDLALELRSRLGDPFGIVRLVQQGGGGDDTLLQHAYDAIGDYYAERQRPAKAAQNYAQSKNAEALIKCYYGLEDYAGLEKLVHALPESSPLLAQLGAKFASVGLAKQATLAYTKAGDIHGAVKACTDLNDWAAAVELGEAHGLADVERLLAAYARSLLDEGKTMMAVELYAKAGRATDAAKLLTQLARADAAAHAPPLRVKKLYVLAALQVESFRKKALYGATTAGGHTTAQTLAGLMKDDATTGSDRSLDSAWRGAEAYHFLCLAQRQLYDGDVNGAMRTAQRLKEYEQVLEPSTIYLLVALTAFRAQFYSQCSRALIKLEALSLPAEQHEACEQLALAIFTRFMPEDPSVRRHACPKCEAAVNDWFAACGECGTHFAACVASGRALVEGRSVNVWRCRTCKHRAYEHEMGGRAHCPLCHAPVDAARQAARP